MHVTVEGEREEERSPKGENSPCVAAAGGVEPGLRRPSRKLHALSERNSNQNIVPSTVREVARAVPDVHASK